MNLADLMQDTGLKPTQKAVWEGNIRAYADQMQRGLWDWHWTATNPREPMIVDTQGHVIAGHHRFVAAKMAGVEIPDNVVKTLPGVTARPARAWDQVHVYTGLRPGSGATRQ